MTYEEMVQANWRLIEAGFDTIFIDTGNGEWHIKIFYGPIVLRPKTFVAKTRAEVIAFILTH